MPEGKRERLKKYQKEYQKIIKKIIKEIIMVQKKDILKKKLLSIMHKTMKL